MGFVVAGVALVGYYVVERVTSLVRSATLERRRGKADYPITGNDPMGRIIV